MKKAEFIKSYISAVRQRRAVNIPTMRPSEIAMASVHDKEKAEKLWKRNHSTLSSMTLLDWEQQLCESHD